MLGVVPTGDDEMSMYVQRRYGQPSTYIERLTLRTDGFVSVNAGYRRGELVTKPITFSGERLEINLSTAAAGEIHVEIQDDIGRPIEGHSEGCRPVRVPVPLTWISNDGFRRCVFTALLTVPCGAMPSSGSKDIPDKGKSMPQWLHGSVPEI